MSKVLNFMKRSYVIIIIMLFYAPIMFATIFSFNKPSDKGALSFTNWNGFTWNSWKEIGTKDKGDAIINSLILGVIVAIFVVILSLVTVFALWRQRNKTFKAFVDSTSNVPLINPDIITAIGMSLVMGIMFGTLTVDSDGMWRAIISHTIMILPFGIMIMYPRSSKFQLSLLEASKDLGYGPIRSWFNTYFKFMLPISMAVIVITLTLSFDDFIITRVTSNTTTIGTKLYESSFKGWALALGAIMTFMAVTASVVFSILKRRKNA